MASSDCLFCATCVSFAAGPQDQITSWHLCTISLQLSRWIPRNSCMHSIAIDVKFQGPFSKVWSQFPCIIGVLLISCMVFVLKYGRRVSPDSTSSKGWDHKRRICCLAAVDLKYDHVKHSARRRSKDFDHYCIQFNGSPITCSFLLSCKFNDNVYTVMEIS